MGLPDLNIRTEYRSSVNNIVKEFYIPLLKEAVMYKRAVGFFSSTALIEISKGITGLIRNGGKIQIVASPKLSEEDFEAIKKGLELRKVVENAVRRCVYEPTNLFEEERLNLLAILIAEGKMDIKIALTTNECQIGIYHEKMGLIYDSDKNIVAFSGSMNETTSALSYNYEAIDVFCSWTKDQERLYAKETAFNAIWNDYEPNLKVLEFTDVADDIFKKYRRRNINLEIDKEEFMTKKIGTIDEQTNAKQFGPLVPSAVKLREYQINAIKEWENRNFVGIFDMATGTGKTYTGLAAICKLFNRTGGKLAVLIVCPYQHLVQQWVDDILKFNMKPIVGYSSSQQKDWKKRLKDSVIAFSLGVIDHFCFISTNATFSSNFVQEQIKKLKGHVVLVVDEAHNFGAQHLSKTLNPRIPYRLALSATLERHGDKEGTQKLKDYFGEKCIEYTLKQAIDNNMLTPYYYYPILVILSEDELEEYNEITRQIMRHCSFDKKGKAILSETAKMLLIKRARLVAAARDKITKLATLMEEYKNESHILVYCGATTMRDYGYSEGKVDQEEKRQIDVVIDLLGNKLGMRQSKFTSEESAEDREELKAAFAEGKHIQALVAIRCLDEGVNIPSIKTAFILASSTNPKEYIQRRGRVLRKYPGKNYAKIYDFITLPVSLKEASNMSDEGIKSIRSLAMKEVTRMKDFASIAENPSISDELIFNISNVFHLNEYGGEEYDL